MFCRVLLLFLVHYNIAEDQEACPAEEGSEFCTQDIKVRHEVRYRKISPSYCFLGQRENFELKKKYGVKSCGWTGISKSVCEESGCCFKNDTCYRPIRPAEVMTYYMRKWVSLDVANETCRRNYMSLYCVQHDEDMEFVSRATCGISWLAGQVAEVPDILNKVQQTGLAQRRKDRTKTEECGQGKGIKINNIKCDRDASANNGLSLSHSGEGFSISAIPVEEKRNLLCSYEIWAPTFKRFPDHVLNGTRKKFRCRANSLTVNQRAVLSSNLTWTIRYVIIKVFYHYQC